MKTSDLKEFKWDVLDYIKYGKENAVNGQWVKQLENASAKFHISKLEALKIQTQQSLEVMFQKQHGTVKDAMQDVFKSGYFHTAYELQKGFNIGFDITGLNQSEIEKVISKPWAVDGYNFSERIWNNKAKLISEVHNELTQNIMLGADPQKAINNISKKMNASKSNAGRLVMTEEAYFSSLSQKECFEELGIEEYEIVATLDSHTSEICQELDGKVFPMKDYQAGTTAPPFHVRCRSTTAPYFSENFGQIGERAARDPETGETYYVPEDMTYKDWEKAFVDGGDKSELHKVDKSDESGIIKGINDDKIYASKAKLGRLENSGWAKKHRKNIVQMLDSDDVPDCYRTVWNRCSDTFHLVDSRYKGEKAYYDLEKDAVLLDITAKSKGSSFKTPYQSVFHEFGHKIDFELNRIYGNKNYFQPYSETYKNGIFGKTIKKEAEKAFKNWKDNNLEISEAKTKLENELKRYADDLRNNYKKSINLGLITTEEVEIEIKRALKIERGKLEFEFRLSDGAMEIDFCNYMINKIPEKRDRADISDMFETIMNYKHHPFGTGHGLKYWKNIDNGTEGFAEMYSAVIANKGSLEQIKTYFPESFEIFEEMLKVVENNGFK